MSSKSAQQQPGEVLARRVKEARERRGWTQGQLAEQVRALGYTLERPVVNRIEQGGTRAGNVSVEDLLALAAALGLAPVNLLVPLEDEALYEVVPGVPVAARLARAWIRGEVLLPISPELDLRDMPKAELLALVEENLAQGMDAIQRALTRDTRRERAREAVEKVYNPDREEAPVG